MPRSLPCTICSEPMVMVRANRKLCNACQTFRDLSYWKRQVDCRGCGKTFYPARSSYTRCYRCSDWKWGRYPGVCGTCGEHNRIAPGLTQTCIACTQESRATQGGYYTALKERDARIRDHATTGRH